MLAFHDYAFCNLIGLQSFCSRDKCWYRLVWLLQTRFAQPRDIDVAIAVYNIDMAFSRSWTIVILSGVFISLWKLHWRRNRSGWSGFGRTTFHGEILKLRLIVNN